MSLLDFSAASSRKEFVRFDLLDEDLNPIGVVHPVGAPELKVERAQPTKRTLSGVTLLPPEASRVTARTRISPVWVFEDGTEFPLGVFVLNDETTVVGDEDRLEAAVMSDQMALYRETLESAFSVRPGDLIIDQLTLLHQRATNPAPRVVADQITATARVGMSWPSGTSISQALDELSRAAGCRVWFDRAGMLRFTIEPDDPTEVIDLRNPINGSLQISYSNEDSPNRWIASAPEQEFAIIGVYDLPDESPHSYARRGRRVVREVEVPGLTDQETADAAAKRGSLEEAFPYKSASAEYPARPDLDAFDFVRLPDGQVYTLDGASTELTGGGTTKIECQAYWENPETLSLEAKLTVEGSEPMGGTTPPMNPRMMWNPEFLRAWRRLTPSQRRHFLAYWAAVDSQRAARTERRRASRAESSVRRNPRSRPRQQRRTGQVQTVDPHTRQAVVLIDGDPQGSEIAVELESVIPGPGERAIVNFDSTVPSIVGVVGGEQRLLGWLRSGGGVQTIDDLTYPIAGFDFAESIYKTEAWTDADLMEVEVTVTQPGRLIMVQASVCVELDSDHKRFELHIYRDDGDGGSFTDVGLVARGDIPVNGKPEVRSGFVIDDGLDPGIYRYKLWGVMGDTGLVNNDISPALIMIQDAGADPNATFST